MVFFNKFCMHHSAPESSEITRHICNIFTKKFGNNMIVLNGSKIYNIFKNFSAFLELSLRYWYGLSVGSVCLRHRFLLKWIPSNSKSVMLL